MEDFRFDHQELLQSLGLKSPEKKGSNYSSSAHSIMNNSNRFNSDQNTKTEIKSNPPKFRSREQEPSNKNQSGSNERVLLLVLTIDLPNNQQINENVYKNDNPYIVAQDICKKYQLSQRYIEPLAQNIIQNAKKVLEQNVASKSSHSENYHSSNEPAHHTSIKNSDFFTLADKENIPRAENTRPREIDIWAQDTFQQTPKPQHKANARSSLSPNVNRSVLTSLRRDQDYARKHRQMSQGKDKSDGKSFDGSLNYCLGLYERGMRKKAQMMKSAAQVKSQVAEELIKDCSFHPKISERSVSIAEKTRRSYLSIEEKLIEDGKISQEIRERAKNIQNALELQECTFKPNLSETTVAIADEQRGYYENRNVHEELYFEHKVQNEKRTYIRIKNAPEYSFKPTLCTSNPYMGDDTSFLERMQKDIENKRAKNLEHQVDSEEFRNLELTFKPIITRGPKEEVRRGPIGEHLYNEAQKIERKKLERLEEEQQKREEKFTKASDKSAAIVDKVTRTRIREIFELLDADRDGSISVDDIALENLSTEILEAFGPLFIELEDLQVSLNEDQFTDAAFRLLKVLDPTLKDKIIFEEKLRWKSKNAMKEYENRFTFQPHINNKSSKLAVNRRRHDSKSVFENLSNDAIRVAQKLNALRDKRDQEMMKECSFKPHINTHLPQSFYAQEFEGLF